MQHCVSPAVIRQVTNPIKFEKVYMVRFPVKANKSRAVKI